MVQIVGVFGAHGHDLRWADGANVDFGLACVGEPGTTVLTNRRLEMPALFEAFGHASAIGLVFYSSPGRGGGPSFSRLVHHLR